ncbi:MAG: uroporphyrinogen-III C-methyltransferase [Pseudomonadota bacterium]
MRRSGAHHLADGSGGSAPDVRSPAASQLRPASGQVWLVGAGPGDPGLLTLKAREALASADVVLFDDLVSKAVVALTSANAVRIAVGKRGGKCSCAQEKINDLMVRHARSGRFVLRLKAGDPGVFARGGEELQFVRAAGIHVEIVPGVTAATAMAATLGISLTHRHHAQTVQFVTGHSRRGELPCNLDWQCIASPDVTTVFYMARRTAGAIVNRLGAAGMPMTTPVAVAASVSCAEQQIWTGSLDQLERGVRTLGHEAPMLLLIGGVAGECTNMSTSHEMTSDAWERLEETTH